MLLIHIFKSTFLKKYFLKESLCPAYFLLPYCFVLKEILHIMYFISDHAIPPPTTGVKFVGVTNSPILSKMPASNTASPEHELHPMCVETVLEVICFLPRDKFLLPWPVPIILLMQVRVDMGRWIEVSKVDRTLMEVLRLLSKPQTPPFPAPGKGEGIIWLQGSQALSSAMIKSWLHLRCLNRTTERVWWKRAAKSVANAVLFQTWHITEVVCHE